MVAHARLGRSEAKYKRWVRIPLQKVPMFKIGSDG